MLAREGVTETVAVATIGEVTAWEAANDLGGDDTYCPLTRVVPIARVSIDL